jgi:hypothetical protein
VAYERVNPTYNHTHHMKFGRYNSDGESRKNTILRKSVSSHVSPVLTLFHLSLSSQDLNQTPSRAARFLFFCLKFRKKIIHFQTRLNSKCCKGFQESGASGLLQNFAQSPNYYSQKYTVERVLNGTCT